MRENRTYGSEGGEGESSSLPLSHVALRLPQQHFPLNSVGNCGIKIHCLCPRSNSEAGTLRTFTAE